MKYILTLLFLLAISLPLALTGRAVIAGGAVSWGNGDINRAFANQASPRGRTSYVGIITAGVSYGIARSTANSIGSQLRRRYGIAKTEWLPFHRSNGGSCTSSAYNSKIRQMTGIYINGGDTQMIVNCLKRNGVTSSALSTIRSRYRSGNLAVFGSSAGALVLQSTPIPGLRSSYSSLTRGPDYIRNGGFGVFTHGFLGVHFTNRGRVGSMTRLIQDLRGSSTIGFGVDQNTAMVMNGESSFQVQGTQGVYVIDVRNAVRGSTHSSNRNRWAVRNVKVSYLTDGDVFYFGSRSISFASNKSRVRETGVAARSSSNIFAPGAFTSVTTSLLRSRSETTIGDTSQSRPKYRFDFRETSNSVAYASGSRLSYRNLYMDVYCLRNC